MSFQSLRIECGKCFGLCCTVLCFSATDGFPVDKKTGVPCPELRHDFSCNIHEALSRKGFKGCLGYDCFGAGQKVSQITFHGKDWRSFPDISGAMFEVFPFMQQLHEMLWYIEEALALPISVGLHEKLKQKKIQTEKLTMKSSEDILKLDIPEYRESIGLLLKETSSLVREEARKSKKFNKPKSRLKKQGIDFIGADLRRYEIVCEDLRGKLLIAADLRASDMSFTDLLGADMRDADIRGADLSKSLFLTQAQVNTAVGDSATSLPVQLIRPTHWQ